MGIGFEVTNDSGSVQVIDTAPLITFREMLTVVEGDITQGYMTYEYVTAFCPANGNTLLASGFNVIRAPNVPDKYRLRGQGQIVRFNENAPVVSGTDRFGLEVYNDAGVLQFTSNHKPLKVLDKIYTTDIRDLSSPIINGKKTYWSKDYGGLKVAAIMVGIPFWGDNPHFMTVALAKRGSVHALEAAIEYTDKAVFDYSGNPIPKWGMHVLIIDVTNY